MFRFILVVSAGYIGGRLAVKAVEAIAEAIASE
jgi:hypothetical protein